MNIQMMEVAEQQLLEVIGSITLVHGATEEDHDLLKQSQAQLVGLVHGLRNVRGAIIRHQGPMTIGELMDRRFQNAKDVTAVINNHFSTEESDSGTS